MDGWYTIITTYQTIYNPVSFKHYIYMPICLSYLLALLIGAGDRSVGLLYLSITHVTIPALAILILVETIRYLTPGCPCSFLIYTFANRMKWLTLAPQASRILISSSGTILMMESANSLWRGLVEIHSVGILTLLVLSSTQLIA